MVVIERDNGRGAPVPPFPATFSRGVYVIDLRDVGSDGFLEKTRIIDLTAIADPDLVSLPPIHAGDVQLGNPFGVACESIEAIHVIDAAAAPARLRQQLPEHRAQPGPGRRQRADRRPRARPEVAGLTIRGTGARLYARTASHLAGKGICAARPRISLGENDAGRESTRSLQQQP